MSATVDPAARLLQRAAERLAAGEAVVQVVVAGGRGSVPGRRGARMLVGQDGARLGGSVGGGAVEQAALEHAARLLAEGAEGATVVQWALGRDLGMSCGGTMELTFDVMRPAPWLLVLGAGHIGQALCRMATVAGFRVTLADARPEWLHHDGLPEAIERVEDAWEQLLRGVSWRPDARVVCTSPGHAIDEVLLRQVAAAAPPPLFVGLVGSRRKGELMRRALREAGVPADFVEALRVPVGLPIGAVTAEEIAVSILAELVAHRRGAVTGGPEEADTP